MGRLSLRCIRMAHVSVEGVTDQPDAEVETNHAATSGLGLGPQTCRAPVCSATGAPHVAIRKEDR